MYREALGRIVAGQPSVYPVRDLVVVSAIQIAASDLARTDDRAAELPDWLAWLARSAADRDMLLPVGHNLPAVAVSRPPGRRSYVSDLMFMSAQDRSTGRRGEVTG